MIRHLVALGDSFTQGTGDPVEGLELRSAHDWLALWMQAANPSLKYTNLASRGLRAAEVRSQQMPRGLKLLGEGAGDSLVSIMAGANDCLRGPFRAEGLRAELGLMFGAFQSTGARLFTATLPNFTLRLELPGGVQERLRRNLESANTVIRELAGQYGAVLGEFWESELEQNPALWSEDGVHPNALGYYRLARWMVPLLQQHGIEIEEAGI